MHSFPVLDSVTRCPAGQRAPLPSQGVVFLVSKLEGTFTGGDSEEEAQRPLHIASLD